MVYDQCLVLGCSVIVVEDQGAIVYIGSPREDFQIMLKDLNLKEEELRYIEYRKMGLKRYNLMKKQVFI